MVEEYSPSDSPNTSRTFAIVTPSWAPDYERCRLLVESVLKFVPETVHHYILVDRRDAALFGGLSGKRTHVLLKEDILPRWLIRVPFFPKWWVSLAGLPVRGWIVQQLAKLSVDLAVDTDVFIFVDSDAFFIRNYDPAMAIVDGKVPLFRQQKEELRIPWNIRWHQVAARLLGLKVLDSYDTSYVGHAMYWTRENLVSLHEHIARSTGSSWIKSVSTRMHLSEYVLYGMYVEHVAGISAGHYFRDSEQSLNYWSEDPIDEPGLRKLKSEIGPDVALVMISAKAPVPAALIRSVFFDN